MRCDLRARRASASSPPLRRSVSAALDCRWRESALFGKAETRYASPRSGRRRLAFLRCPREARGRRSLRAASGDRRSSFLRKRHIGQRGHSLAICSVSGFGSRDGLQNLARDFARLATLLGHLTYFFESSLAGRSESAEGELQHFQIFRLPQPPLRWHPRLEQRRNVFAADCPKKADVFFALPKRTLGERRRCDQCFEPWCELGPVHA